MTPLAVALALALGASPVTEASPVMDACAPVDTPATADPAAAAQYRAVGDAERAAGRADTATAAYRAALQSDGGDEASRSALAALCAEQRREGSLRRGLRLMQADDLHGAIAELEKARAQGERDAFLLEGICWYRLEQDGRAEPLLREAEKDPENRDSARYFLGLIAMRDGRGREAATLLEQSAADRELAPLARDLARYARRQGRVVVSALAESGWDTNVDLTPDGSPLRGSAGDGAAGLAVAVSVNPLGESGPYLRGSGVLREQFTFDDFDTRAAGVTAGWQLGRGLRYVAAEYGYDYRNIGGEPYLSAHRLLGTGRIDLSRAWSAGAIYVVRRESFLPSDIADYSGWRQLAEADARVALARTWLLTGAWRLGRDDADAAPLSWWEQGPRLALATRFGPVTRLRLDAAWTHRTYDAFDPALGVARSDSYLDVTGALERDVSALWTIRFSLTARKATSNVAEFRYTTVAPMLGIAYTVGVL